MIAAGDGFRLKDDYLKRTEIECVRLVSGYFQWWQIPTVFPGAFHLKNFG